MNREIRFKGNDISDGIATYYGDLVINYDALLQLYFIHNRGGNFLSRVNPDTICEFSGFTDCNGYDIYEHDIVLVNGYSEKEIIVDPTRGFRTKDLQDGTIGYISGPNCKLIRNDVTGEVFE